jgi:hypothetical protein
MYADNGASCFLNATTGECLVKADGETLESPPARPKNVFSTYPFTAAVVMLPLKPGPDNMVTSAELVIFGGGYKADHGPSQYDPQGFTGGYCRSLSCSLLHQM